MVLPQTTDRQTLDKTTSRHDWHKIKQIIHITNTSCVLCLLNLGFVFSNLSVLGLLRVDVNLFLCHKQCVWFYIFCNLKAAFYTLIFISIDIANYNLRKTFFYFMWIQSLKYFGEWGFFGAPFSSNKP